MDGRSGLDVEVDIGRREPKGVVPELGRRASLLLAVVGVHLPGARTGRTTASPAPARATAPYRDVLVVLIGNRKSDVLRMRCEPAQVTG